MTEIELLEKVIEELQIVIECISLLSGLSIALILAVVWRRS